MDQQKLLKFVQTLITLKEKLKCPICIDVMQEVTELDCGHRYCEQCYDEHKSTLKQVACPLCKKIVKRRSMKYKDSYLNALGKFVYNSCKNIQDVYKCEVEQLRQNLCTSTDPIPQVQAGILKQNVNSNTITRTLPSTSKTNDKRRKRPNSKENCENAFDKLMQGASASSAFNRNATRRVYVNKKKLEKKPEYNILEFDNYENKTAVLRWLNDTRNLFDRLTQTQNFEEEHIPSPIVELKSISQEKEKENFKSIGKRNVRKLRAKSLDIEIKKPVPKDPKRYSDGGGTVIIENYNIEDINTEEEEVVKKVEEKVLLDLMEDEFLNKLDSELQNRQDSNNGQSKTKKMSKKTRQQGNTPCSGSSATGWDRITKIKKTIKKSEKVPKQLNITLQSNQTSTDKEINNLKLIEKNYVATPQPSNNTSDNFDNVDTSKQGKHARDKIEIVEQNKVESVGVIDLHHITNKTSEYKAPDSVETEKSKIHRKSYDFNKVEDYIAKNIKTLDRSLDSNTLPHIVLCPNKTIDKDVVELGVEKEHTGTVTKSNKSHLSDSKYSPIVQKTDQIETKEASTIFVNGEELFMMPTQKILNNSDHTIPKEKNIVIDNDVKEISVQTSGHDRQDITEKLNTVLQDQSKHKNKAEVFTLKLDDILSVADTCVSEHDHQDTTDASKVEHQYNKPKSKETIGKEVVFDDYDMDELYALPTQKIKHSCKDVTAKFEALVENSCSTDGLLHLFEESLDKCLASLKSTDVVDAENHLHSLQFLVAKFKLLNKENNNELVKVSSTNTHICNAATQTVVETVDEKVQTENKCVANTEVQTEEIHCFKCNGDLHNVNVGAKVISQSTKTAIESMMNEPNANFKLLDQNASNISKRNTPTVKPSSQNEMFTATFDNLNFETQELTKNQGFILRNSETKSDKNLLSNLSMRSNKEVLSRGTEQRVGENLPGSILVCSLETTNPTCPKKVNKKLTYDEGPSKKFKRIRLPTSDSDSEGEVEVKRKCNRFIRDDLTIEIHTNTERIREQEEELKSASEPQDSDYDDYLAEILKKYDDPNFSTNSSNKTSRIVSSRKEAAINKVTKCEETIPYTNKNIQNIKDMNNVSCESSKDSFQTASQSINNFDAALAADNMFMDEGNLLKLEKDIRAYEKSSIKDQNSEISDIIGATEELEPLPKRPKYNTAHRENPQSVSLFSPSENLGLRRQKSDVSDDVCQELNDSLDEADLEIIEEQTNLNKSNTSAVEKIKIIENIKIKSQDRKGDIKEEEDDLFSDEDIVETTPQKKINSFAERSILSQIDNLANLPLKDNLPTPLSNTENFEFDFEALPPPPDFQDDIQSPENIATEIPPNHEPTIIVPDITTTSINKFSLTPDNLSQFNVKKKNAKDDMSQIISSNILYNNTNKEDQGQNNLSLTPDKLSQFDINPGSRNMMHSTPVSQRNLAREAFGISPISAKKNQQSSIIEMAQTSKFTPLSSITKSNPQKNTILTSTPGQKSIWNYVKQPSQSSEKEAAPVTKTKPCIACTRLTKDQIKSISQLTSKKLATYSSNFDASVTHMIVAVNEDNYVKDYTIKFVSAVAAGIWVLRFDWIEECLSNSCIVPEEPFEALDISGLPGPRTSRLTRKTNPLFKGYKFYCANPFINTTQQEVEEIIKMLGGKILRDIKDLLEDDGNIGLIIGEGHGTQDFEHYERWVELYKTVTVDIEWLSKCVGQYKLISIRPYVWCSEDNLGDLGYPPFLTETVPLSFTETF